MFNVRPERLVPWIYVEPPPADEVPGFRMNADGSVRDTQHSTPSGSFGFGALPGTLTPRHPEAAQTLAQPTLGGLTPSPDFLAQPPLATGLAQFRSGRQDDVPGFNFRLLEDVVPALNFFESESSPLRHATPWSDRAFPTPSDYPDTALAPSGVEELAHLAPLPAWLATVPVPRLSTAFDPRTGRRIVPHEPLIGPIRHYLAADEHSRGMEDIRPDVTGSLPDLDSAEAPGAEEWPSFDPPAWPADINTDPSATTAQHANRELSPETKRGLDFERAVLHALNAANPTTKINKNTGKISVEGLGRSIPDVLQKGIREIKSGVEIDNSVQLRVQAAYAKLFGVPLNLIVSPTTKRISQEVRKRVQETGGTIQRFDPATGAFTPF